MGKSAQVKLEPGQFLVALDQMYGDKTKKKEVSFQEPKNNQEMHDSFKSGNRCYNYNGNLVMMSPKDAEKLKLKPVMLYEGFKTYQAKRGKDVVAVGKNPAQQLGALEGKKSQPNPPQPVKNAKAPADTGGAKASDDWMWGLATLMPFGGLIAGAMAITQENPPMKVVEKGPEETREIVHPNGFKVKIVSSNEVALTEDLAENYQAQGFVADEAKDPPEEPGGDEPLPQENNPPNWVSNNPKDWPVMEFDFEPEADEPVVPEDPEAPEEPPPPAKPKIEYEGGDGGGSSY